jgi:hypothetical protein
MLVMLSARRNQPRGSFVSDWLSGGRVGGEPDGAMV